MKRSYPIPVLVALLAVGCATTKDIDTKVAEAQAKTEKKIESVEAQVETLQDRQKKTEVKVEDQGKEIANVSKTASDALKRAQEAGVLAKGKIVFEQTFKEDRVKFKVDSAVLDKDAKAALDEMAPKIKALAKQYYVEIQGHTDSTGGAEHNDALGQKRADAVRLYLARQHQLPLQRMSTISYGSTEPVDQGKGAKARAANRRVVVVVLE